MWFTPVIISFTVDTIKKNSSDLINLYKITRANSSSSWQALSKTIVALYNYSYAKYKYSKNKEAKQLSGARYEVKYTIKGIPYRFITRKKRGPSKIMSITTGSGKLVTEKIREYLGPCEDFHSTDLTPNDLDEDVLIFDFSNGIVARYEKNEKIIIPF